MELESAIHLTQVFRNQVENKRLDPRSICISVEAANGAEITTKVTSPIQAAQYMRFLLKNDHPLFQRGEHDFPFGRFPDPIVFKAWGRYRNPLNNLEFAVMSIRLRFFQEASASELCFDDDFCRTDWETPFSRVSGPPIRDFINALERAGTNWNEMSFTTLKNRSARHAHLKIVK